MKQDIIQRYFQENSQAWFATSYETDGHVYPIAATRTKRVVEIIKTLFPSGAADVVDLGCGGGHLALRLAQASHQVVAVDQSVAMLSEASSAIKAMPEEIQSKVRLVEANVTKTGLEGGCSDAVTSMGVIGYLTDDDGIFQEASRLLRSKGVFIVSCRNRLFNMVSLSDYTLREIEQGSAAELVREIRDLFEAVPREDAVRFVEALAQASNGLLSKMAVEPASTSKLSDTAFTTSIDPRQHTPDGLAATARENGFESEGFYGVHPHLMMAGFNKLLPPYVFNDLSDALNGLDNHPLSLIWSSVFIGVFRKQD